MKMYLNYFVICKMKLMKIFNFFLKKRKLQYTANNQNLVCSVCVCLFPFKKKCI